MASTRERVVHPDHAAGITFGHLDLEMPAMAMVSSFRVEIKSVDKDRRKRPTGFGIVAGACQFGSHQSA
jgi:hypothetical protein